MFETPLQDQLKSVKDHWEKKVELEPNEKLRNLYRSDIEEQIKKAQDKYFGNVRFIGELYLHDLLKPKIINCCITSLLPKTIDENAMLSLCKLLETCGKKFDEKHGDKMSSYIKSMTEIVENEHLKTRIRFRIMDIIEMSQRKWVLREIQSQKMIRPKTLEELKNDTSDEKSVMISKFPQLKLSNRNNVKPMQNQSELTYSYGFNYQYPNMYMQNYTSQGYYPNLPSNIDNVPQAPRQQTEKRKTEPITVIDPTNDNKPIDLHKFSKSKTTSSTEGQLSDKSNILIPDLMSINKIEDNNNKIIEEQSSLVTEDPVKIETEIKKEVTENDNSKSDYLLSPPNSQSMKQSHSIPNKLDNLTDAKFIQRASSSSETDLYPKSNTSFIELEELLNSQRKVYNRDILMEIGKHERSLKLPLSLEKFECKEIILSESSDSSKLLIHQMYGRLKPLGKIIRFNSPKTGSLSRIVNGYLPPHLRLKEECSLNKNLENCRRNLKCILNKIAPQNFLLCINEIKSIIKSNDQENVKIEDCIDCLIEEIFDKAVKEEAYSVTYANLCSNIAKFDDENESKWNFKSSLLNRCKKMFETPLQDQLKSVKDHWEKKVELEPDEKLRNLYRSDIEEQIKKAQDKYFGNVRFIGELYLQDLLKPKIINCCVTSLLPKTNDEDAMLSLCKLLETCGKKFDEKHGDKMSSYIKSMTEIVENEHLETRIRFRILDIIEMSQRKWILREIQSQKMVRPKTLEEVKNDNSDEKSAMISKYPQLKLSMRNNVKPMQNQSELRLKPSTRTQSIDVNSLSVAQTDSYELKPSYGNWAGTKEKDSSEWKNVDGKKRTKNKYPQSGKQQLNIQNKSSPVRNADESSNKSYKTKYDIFHKESLDNSDSPVRCSSPCESKSEDDTVIMDSDELLDNLLETSSLNMTAWYNQNKISELITHWLDRIMEKNKRDRNLVGDQLANLVACEKLPKELLIEGLTQFIDLIDDLITDIPVIWTFFAEVLERFIQNSDSYIEFYRNIFECRLPNEKINECIFLILEYANERLGNANIEELIDNKLQFLLDFTKNSEDFDSQIQKHGLTFLLNSEPTLSDDKFTDSFKSELISRLPNDIENIYVLLESKFTLQEMQTDEFVYSLTYCIFSFICELPSENEIIEFLIEKQLFFRRFIDSKSPLETQTLLALVNFANRLEERDLLKTIVQNLTGKTISKEACQHFIHNPVSTIHNDLENNSANYELIVKAIRSTLENDQR